MHRTANRVLLLGLSVSLGLGCADDLAPEEVPEGDGGVEEIPLVSTTENGDRLTTLVNSSNYDDWVYFSFDELDAPIELGDPLSSMDWDLGFRRFEIKLNGGVSGPGPGELHVVDGATSIDAVTEAPVDGYVTDLVDVDDDDDEDPEYAFTTELEGWYDYDPANHVLTPKSRVYVVRAASDSLYKLTISSYYSPGGSSGYFSFDWSDMAVGVL